MSGDRRERAASGRLPTAVGVAAGLVALAGSQTDTKDDAASESSEHVTSIATADGGTHVVDAHRHRLAPGPWVPAPDHSPCGRPLPATASDETCACFFFFFAPLRYVCPSGEKAGKISPASPCQPGVRRACFSAWRSRSCVAVDGGLCLARSRRIKDRTWTTRAVYAGASVVRAPLQLICQSMHHPAT